MTIDRTQRRLGLALTWYLVVVIVVVTLVPFGFEPPTGLRLVGFATVADVVQNIALFVPLGFVVAFAGRWQPVLIGAGLSLSVELLQQLLPARSPSLIDLVTNTLGAGLGGLVYQAIRRTLMRSSRVGVLALDLPLMGLVYLTIPLLWLSGLGHDGDPVRRWLLGLVGLGVAVILASVARHHLVPRGVPKVVVALFGGLLFAVGLAPGWFLEPTFLISCSLSVALGVLLLGEYLTRAEPDGRRYEVPTVRRALVPLTVYLLCVALWPVVDLAATWQGGVLPSRPVRELGNAGILQLLELMAVCSVIGYATAEILSRAADRAPIGRVGALTSSAAAGGVLIGLRGFSPGYGASLIEGLLLGFAVWIGALLFWRQRAYVLALLGKADPHRVAGQHEWANVSLTARRSEAG
ncbi:MAG: VanZ family protein [Gemmatimonadales bacterium]|nr:VanZ family protein [Gemmatimonadales bacterium]